MMRIHAVLSVYILHTIFLPLYAANISVIGTGYVGLITGAGLADIGHYVMCLDNDINKIEKLKQFDMPIYETGLEAIVKKNVQESRLIFTADAQQAIAHGDIIIIAVGTPTGEQDNADLSALHAVVDTIIQHSITTIKRYSTGYKIICIKSTVPVGTNNRIKGLLEDTMVDASFDIVSNPEFLREGSAIRDFFECNPIVLGSESQKALQIMQDVYRPLTDKGADLITTNLVTAETIKYAWNAFSATRITYVNELAHFCNATGADIDQVVKGMSYSTKLLPTEKLRPGPGYGGSCFPKDTRALVAIAKEQGVDLQLVSTVIKTNEVLKLKAAHMLVDLLNGDVAHKTIAILGLSFKAETNDVRCSPAITVIQELVRQGALIKAYDPQAMQDMKKLFPDIMYCVSWQEACKGADGVIVLTEWQEFKDIHVQELAKLVYQKIIVDVRNLFSPRALKKAGFVYTNLSRQI